MMTTREECICCCSISEVVSKMEETGASCITESKGFDAVCLNQWVLQTAYYQYTTGNSMGGILNLYMSMFNTFLRANRHILML